MTETTSEILFDRRGAAGLVTLNRFAENLRPRDPVEARMILDQATLFTVATGITGLLGVFLIVLWIQERSVRALGWWGAAYILGAASIALWTVSGNDLGGWLSLAVNAVGFMACGMVWDAARVFHGRSANLLAVCRRAYANPESAETPFGTRCRKVSPHADLSGRV